MRLIIIYNIKDEKKRRMTGRLLLNYGEKIKNGVFECSLNYNYYKKLGAGLNAIGANLKGEEYIRVYPLCQDCNKKIKSYGKARSAAEPLYYLA
ncbi:MAG: CRISPR-associated endonuclease Cas2 [Ignavibacteriaceae bacterium]|nr:CRISPR-associated endonuclease Cas2 [Ignavibacteriaceae bacterium]